MFLPCSLPPLQQVLSGGSPSGPGDCPSRLLRTIEGLHDSNIIAIASCPERQLLVTGSSDGNVAMCAYDGTLQRTVPAASSGVLCMAVQPGDASGSDSSLVVAAGCMDGSVCVLDALTGAVLARASPHRK